MLIVYLSHSFTSNITALRNGQTICSINKHRIPSLLFSPPEPYKKNIIKHSFLLPFDIHRYILYSRNICSYNNNYRYHTHIVSESSPSIISDEHEQTFYDFKFLLTAEFHEIKTYKHI
jgi:hypothetical protein